MTIRIGVIGAGHMGAHHIANLSTSVSGAEVSFVADVDECREVFEADADIVAATGYPDDWRQRFADAFRLQLQAWILALSSGAYTKVGHT